MRKGFEYTTLAQRYTAKFPVISYVGTQVNFWIIANLLLMVIVRLYSNMISEAFHVPVVGDFSTMVWIGVILGMLYGVGLGITGYYLDKRFFRKLPLGKVILYKTVISMALFALVLLVLRFILVEIFISPSLTIAGIRLNEQSWDYLFYLLLVYYFVMTLIISFVNQVNRKYGPGVLVPLLLGQYRTPKEVERIFMFMDLKSSTATAERLGHLKYSAFIRDCFSDINEVLYEFRAQVYQYVGDEIVVMWPTHEGLEDCRCVKFYFAVVRQFLERSMYYISTFGVLPVFKAGMHMGKVTAVEIGEIKKEIAYHGDTVNTAARIQTVCSVIERDFIVSETLMENTDCPDLFQVERLGLFELKGKSEKIALLSISLK
jgi:adenylate cyclase